MYKIYIYTVYVYVATNIPMKVLFGRIVNSPI